MHLTPHPSRPASAQCSRLGVCRMRGPHCACSQAPKQQGHLVPKQMLPSVELLARRLRVCLRGWGGGYLNERMHHQEKDRSLSCEGSYPLPLSVTSGPIHWICVRLSKKSADRNPSGFVTGQTALDQHLAQQSLRSSYCKWLKRKTVLSELFCQYRFHSILSLHPLKVAHLSKTVYPSSSSSLGAPHTPPPG